jgi:hypothetical protein
LIILKLSPAGRDCQNKLPVLGTIIPDIELKSASQFMFFWGGGGEVVNTTNFQINPVTL